LVLKLILKCKIKINVQELSAELSANTPILPALLV
jgi:hypothetical protein